MDRVGVLSPVDDPDQPALPSVFDYLDHREWLRDWFAAKRAQNPRYSHRLFAMRAGFRSPSMLHLVMTGQRNLTDASFARFCKALGLSAPERAHFRALVDLDRATSPAARTEIYEKLRARQHFRGASEIEEASFDFLSDWALPAIYELAGHPRFRMDPRWLARQLRPRVSEARVRNALDTLVTLGLLEPDEHGGARAVDKAVVTAHEVQGLAVYRYHRSMGSLAMESLEWAEPSIRHFGAVTVRVAPAQLEQLKHEVAAFQERVLAICDAEEGTADDDRDRVVQLNLQLFPLSRRVDP